MYLTQRNFMPKTDISCNGTLDHSCTSSSSVSETSSFSGSKNDMRRPCQNGWHISWRGKITKLGDASRTKSRENARSITLTSLLGLHTSVGDMKVGSLVGKTKKKVVFAMDRNQVHTITASTAERSQCWWTAEELKQSHTMGKRAAARDTNVKAYIAAFAEAHRQVCVDHKLSRECRKMLVRGLSQEYRGLEQYSSQLRNSVAIRTYVLSVVQCYQDLQSKNHWDDSMHSRSVSSVSTVGSGTGYCDCALRNHSVKLSSGDRRFAVALGNAEQMALILKARPVATFSSS